MTKNSAPQMLLPPTPHIEVKFHAMDVPFNPFAARSDDDAEDQAAGSNSNINTTAGDADGARDRRHPPFPSFFRGARGLASKPAGSGAVADGGRAAVDPA